MRRTIGGFVIVASLWAGLDVAVANATSIRSAKQARIEMEIDQLHQAFMAYKEKHLAFPPSMSELNITARRVRFMRHVQTAFMNARYGAEETDFVKLRDEIKAGFGPNTQGYNFKNAAGETKPLDLDTLDQAETLIFWLGGFPTPYNTANRSSIANRRIFGFHRDQDSPFKRDTIQQEGADPMRWRTELLYQFDETRLTDIDEDGWYEYSPLPPSMNDSSAPFVYFDADSYVKASSAVGAPLRVELLGYPRSGDLRAADLAAQVGLAVPLAEFVDPLNAKPILWHNPESFQIICGGRDEAYSDPVEQDLDEAYRVPVFPGGEVFLKSDFNVPRTQRRTYSEPELDNLTNMSRDTLEVARANTGFEPVRTPWGVKLGIALIVVIVVVALAVWRHRRANPRTVSEWNGPGFGSCLIITMAILLLLGFWFFVAIWSALRC